MLILQHRIYRADLQANPAVLYVFGDNEERWGRGGQAAEMRDEPNAVGVATLKAPGVFWTESDVARQCAVIDADMAPLFEALRAGRTVIFPLDGIGSGLADLERRSPTTWAHLQHRINELKSAGEA
ncbi:DUF7831 domain-containing protein [Brevundimonas pondensis]|uniref:DUF7831 domain-containing protein n=1 Tax=Brevundimonas pondensis TaxID=2774189 RepID=A0ABX7SNR4_9CAUL|nr:hypothetical protein [Brevundimonas pondensis]QTC88068.1 hypothetical protein IFE19_01280 [Brevundimonas pondensis]